MGSFVIWLIGRRKTIELKSHFKRYYDKYDIRCKTLKHFPNLQLINLISFAQMSLTYNFKSW